MEEIDLSTYEKRKEISKNIESILKSNNSNWNVYNAEFRKRIDLFYNGKDLGFRNVYGVSLLNNVEGKITYLTLNLNKNATQEDFQKIIKSGYYQGKPNEMYSIFLKPLLSLKDISSGLKGIELALNKNLRKDF